MLVLLISVILIYGFGILTYLFFVHHTAEEQVSLIIIHLAVSVILFLLWSFDKKYRSVFKENRILRAMLSELEGYKATSCILSYTHFLSHVNYIVTSTKRRGRVNHLLRIEIDENAENISSLEYVLLDAASKNFRTSFFDLVTQRVRNEVLVFLQDTTLEGCKIAIDRLISEISERITLERLPFTFHIYEIENLNEIENIDNIPEYEGWLS